ncbi:hypothetical protein [Bradyrhizobium sp. B039]|uniref:hypothetical protein n=1 Tax=Bradyrhizobium sp. B039 TaxID=3140239 RepID=UPI003183AB22
MTSFELELDEKSRAGAEFMARVIDEIRRAVAAEKTRRKLTQQAIAEKIGTSRAVVNRQIGGLENLTARRIGELLWAIGWEPHFEARPIPEGNNEIIRPTATAPRQPANENRGARASALGGNTNRDGDHEQRSAAQLAYA